jgi:hypothetical protein
MRISINGEPGGTARSGRANCSTANNRSLVARRQLLNPRTVSGRPVNHAETTETFFVIANLSAEL